MYKKAYIYVYISIINTLYPVAVSLNLNLRVVTILSSDLLAIRLYVSIYVST